MDLEKMRHSTAHIMAVAVCRLFKHVQLDIGPTIADGFYYDFDLPQHITPDDFPRIEREMAQIIKDNIPFERIEVTREKASEMLKAQGQTYKLERLSDIPEGECITFYQCGDFSDLCRGPHVARTGDIKAFKLLSVAGSYYRGLETNPMLQRIYGTTANSNKELKQYLNRLEEKRKRDHRKLGKALDLFSIHDEVGPGLVHWHPKGARIRSIIEEFWRQEHLRNGYDLLYTPHIGKASLWETSGHLDFYKESMYSAIEIDESQYFIKPMNCPFHIQVYKSHKRSYRDLPLRWAELGTVYRYEKTGVLHGLLRARGFTQDDAHIFCTPDQIEQEITRAVQFAMTMFKTFGFTQISAYLSTRPKKAIGKETLWQQATNSLEQALKASSIPYHVDESAGAFYGPKIDLTVKDVVDREWQMSTIQFDFNLPDRFDMTYVGEDGQDHQPFMVHRALLGSIERFFGILIEQYGGAFPLWLAPEQVRILPLTDKQNDYALSISDELKKSDIRVKFDTRSEKIGAKIRDAQIEKIPYMVIIGPKEVEAKSIAVRSRTNGDQGMFSITDFVRTLKEEESKRQ